MNHDSRIERNARLPRSTADARDSDIGAGHRDDRIDRRAARPGAWPGPDITATIETPKRGNLQSGSTENCSMRSADPSFALAEQDPKALWG